MSKILSTGLRIGYIVCDIDLCDKIEIMKQVNDVHTNIFSQIIAERWLDTCDFEAHLELCRNVYKKKCELMLKTMDECFEVYYRRFEHRRR